MPLPSTHDVALAAERRAAARLLLAHPLITSTGPHRDTFPLVRKHADWLAQRFQQVFGYRLLVDAGYARLFKAGLGPGAGHRLERPSTGTPFTPRTYAYLTLALSVLVTAPEQLLLSQLVADLRAAAVDAGLEITDSGRQAERRTLAAALRQLVDWGVLSETEGQVSAVAEDGGGEALLTVDRDIARAVVAGPLTQSRDGADLVRRAADPGFGGPRTYVRRRLVETPVVHLDDLTDAEREWLRTRQRREAQAFSELLGLEAEIRAEGIALVDPDAELTDLHLPGTGTVAQAALLLVGRLVDRLRPEHPAGGRLVIGVPVPEGLPSELLGELIEEYGRRGGWQRGLLEDRDGFLAAVLDHLTRMRLLARAGPVRADGHGLPEAYEAKPTDSRTATDVSGARPRDGAATWTLLAAAARYATTVTVNPRRTATADPTTAPGRAVAPGLAAASAPIPGPRRAVAPGLAAASAPTAAGPGTSEPAPATELTSVSEPGRSIGPAPAAASAPTAAGPGTSEPAPATESTSVSEPGRSIGPAPAAASAPAAGPRRAVGPGLAAASASAAESGTSESAPGTESTSVSEPGRSIGPAPAAASALAAGPRRAVGPGLAAAPAPTTAESGTSEPAPPTDPTSATEPAPPIGPAPATASAPARP
ncbi:TIGR02678 family protein, partial [Streptomyces sp. S6]